MKEELIVLEEVKYPVSADEIKAFVSEWKNIPELDPLNEDKEPYLAVKKAHLQSVKFRTSIEKRRKELKAPVIAYGKTVDRIAKEYQELIHTKELELFDQRNKVDQYEKEQEQKRIDEERERVELIGAKITALKMIPLDSMGENSETLTAIYMGVAIPSEEEYQERLDEATITFKDTMYKLEAAIDTAKKAEQAEAIQAESEAKRKEEDEKRVEAERLDREKFEAEKRAFKEQKEAQERAIRDQQEEIDRQNKAKELEEIAQKEAQERAIRDQQEAQELKTKELENIESVARAYDYTLKTINELCDTPQDVLDLIIDGEVPNVFWEIDND